MNFKLEKKLKKRGYAIIIGVDEAGRGPLAGPVVACAVVLKNLNFTTPAFGHPSLNKEGKGEVKNWNLVRDSKKLSEKQREGMFDFIHKNFYVGVGMCDHKTIDRINILQASLLAMKKAIQNLQRNLKQEPPHPPTPSPGGRGWLEELGEGNKKSIILVDGNKIIPNLKMEQQAIVGGDRKVKSISAASIVAKVTRDRLMQKWHKKYPQYGFAKHKGYGTKLHLQKLKKFGPSSIHRLSFQPVKDWIFLPKLVFDVKFREEKITNKL